jgi:hypothetical protein
VQNIRCALRHLWWCSRLEAVAADLEHASVSARVAIFVEMQRLATLDFGTRLGGDA